MNKRELSGNLARVDSIGGCHARDTTTTLWETAVVNLTAHLQ